MQMASGIVVASFNSIIQGEMKQSACTPYWDLVVASEVTSVKVLPYGGSETYIIRK